MPIPPSPPSPTPALLAQRYRLERKLAQGGMAEVWLATDVSLRRQVAIKVLKSALATDEVVVERFRREVITVARLSHPNIVAVHDTIDFDGRQAVVMQLVNGKSLRQLLDDQRRLSPELTIHIGTCVAAALDAAHAAGLVHRDVKPGNIMITPDGRVLLTDFGIAKGLSAPTDLTSDNVMMGTAKYLSPEQVRGKKLDGRADLYALGLVLYECLAGQVPFLGESDADTALARLQRDPTDLARLRPTLPYGLVELIHRLLARNPQDRPATGGELKAMLTRIASGVDDPTTTLTPPSGTVVPSERVAEPLPTLRNQTPGRGELRTAPGTPRSGSSRPIIAPPPATRDRTPTSGSPRGVPAKQFQQRKGPSMVVIGLLIAALLIAAGLFAVLQGDDKQALPPEVTAGPTTLTLPAAIATLAAVTDYDPDDPDLEGENPDLVNLAFDGDASTVWRTNCYESKFFGGKNGVGLVAELSTPSRGGFSLTMQNGPYQVDVYTSTAATIPISASEWGSPIQNKSSSLEPGVVTASINAEPVHFVLFLLREAGPDTDCNAKRPYRSRVAEISFTPAP
jgi:eukaryotic-like serine/threonine-protein kinase